MYIQARIYLKQLLYQKPIIWKVVEAFQGLQYSFDYYYYYKWRGRKDRLSVREINIEFASQCNLRCRFCSLDHSKPKTLITEEILDRFFLELITNDRFRQVEIINLHNGGEILLHPKRLEMLGVVKKYKEQARQLGIKFPKIFLLTNGMLLREKLAQQIIDLDVVDVIGLSMDGGSPEAFEEMRVQAKWPIFYQNLKTFCRLNDAAGHPIETYCICCIPDERPLNTKWMDPEFRNALETLDRYELRKLHNWAGELQDALQRKRKPHKIGCALLMKQLVLLPNGDVTVCCNDLNAKGVIGNIMQDELVDIYDSPERLNYLEKLLKGKKSELELCKDCETF